METETSTRSRRLLGRGTYLQLTDDLGASMETSLREALTKIISYEKQRIVIDVGKTPLLGLRAIDAMIWASDCLRTSGGQVEVRNATAHLERLLDVLGLSSSLSLTGARELPLRRVASASQDKFSSMTKVPAQVKEAFANLQHALATC